MTSRYDKLWTKIQADVADTSEIGEFLELHNRQQDRREILDEVQARQNQATLHGVSRIAAALNAGA